MATEPYIDRRGLLKTLGAVSTSGMGLGTIGSEAISAQEADAVRFVEPDSGADFNYPYFLYVPPMSDDRERALLVAPNNTGTTSDDFAEHQRSARQQVERGFPRAVAEELDVPLLVPVFPRPESDPVDWTHYVHALDRETLQLGDGRLERVDLQLLAMVDHAISEELSEASGIREEILLDGFSASGTFADRFTVLHPERVLSVTAGGLNGMPLLPLAEAKGHTLNYHVGIADVEAITGKSPDTDALSDVNQFLYMGAEDENDTLPYDDAWTQDELQETARDVYGDDMIEDRFPYSQTAYEQADIDAQFRIYEGIGHEFAPLPDVVEFHRRSLEGEDISEFGHDLEEGAAGQVVDQLPADTPSPSPTPSPTSTPSSAPTGDQTPETAEPQTAPTETQVQEEDDTPSESTPGDSGPGFGFGGALVGVGGSLYLLRERLSDD